MTTTRQVRSALALFLVAGPSILGFGCGNETPPAPATPATPSPAATPGPPSGAAADAAAAKAAK